MNVRQGGKFLRRRSEQGTASTGESTYFVAGAIRSITMSPPLYQQALPLCPRFITMRHLELLRFLQLYDSSIGLCQNLSRLQHLAYNS